MEIHFEIYSKLTVKTPELRHWRRSEVFIVNFEQKFLYPVLKNWFQVKKGFFQLQISEKCHINRISNEYRKKT